MLYMTYTPEKENDARQWQYINTEGKAVTGWLTTTKGNKYWFDDKGIMVSGKWLQISGKWYYFGADGKLEVDTTIDGYKVGADGRKSGLTETPLFGFSGWRRFLKVCS